VDDVLSLQRALSSAIKSQIANSGQRVRTDESSSAMTVTAPYVTDAYVTDAYVTTAEVADACVTDA
jgi:hypothetical protein